MSFHAVMVAAPLKNGRPDLQLGREGDQAKLDANYFSSSWEGHNLCLRQTGVVRGNLVFTGIGSRGALGALSHLGSNIRLLDDVSKNDITTRDALIAAGVRKIKRVRDNAIVGLLPQVALAGMNAMYVSLASSYDQSEEYVVE